MRPGGSILSHVLRHLVLIAGLVIMLAPFVWMVSTSLKPPNEIFSTKLSLLPTKGITLPLVSNGGSSLLISLLAMGMLLNISQHESAEA